MQTTMNGRARAVADLDQRELLASVDVAAPPERAFRALASGEITKWWVRPGVFDTREWTGDLRPGGRWSAAGMSRGQPYSQGGEFITIDAPRTLVHTWDGVGPGGGPSTLTYALEPVSGGTRITLRQSGFVAREACENFAIGWETSFERMAQILANE